MKGIDELNRQAPIAPCFSAPRQNTAPSCGTKKPYIEPMIRTIAGALFAIFSLLLYYDETYALVWLAILLFIAFNLFQSGLSGYCMMERLLKCFNLTSELDEIKALSQELQAKTHQQAEHLDTLNLLNEAVIELSPGGQILSASEGWARIISQPSSQHTIDQQLTHFLNTQDRHLLAELPAKLEHRANHTLRRTFRLTTSSGQTKWICANFMLTGTGGETLVKGVLRDVSEVKHLENERHNFQQELAHARRLSNLGEMAAGLAHELNQPLAAVNLYIQGCLKRLENDPDDTQAIIAAMDAAGLQAKRAGNIIQQIRGFVRKAPLKQVQTDINLLLMDAVHLLDVDPDVQHIVFNYELAGQLPLIPLDPLQIQQVLINLIQNAIDAMQGETKEAKKVLLRTQLHHDSVVVEVIDYGPGVPESVAAEIFEPFITSRSDGLGLGLAICRSIIEQHGGTIQHASPRSGGSCFSFTLPITIQQEDP
ncbi:hypothetical protein MNBD_GAMMA13-1373 [hydrothermal vent metagenome]|uniref:Histidine kinase domain-containing protein n=1 Tax=hydrothermal vent metagenome TaxID=652676 RepID=A0A3B0XZQ0_9ZZZZ